MNLHGTGSDYLALMSFNSLCERRCEKFALTCKGNGSTFRGAAVTLSVFCLLSENRFYTKGKECFSFGANNFLLDQTSLQKGLVVLESKWKSQ